MRLLPSPLWQTERRGKPGGFFWGSDSMPANLSPEYKAAEAAFRDLAPLVLAELSRYVPE